MSAVFLWMIDNVMTVTSPSSPTVLHVLTIFWNVAVAFSSIHNISCFTQSIRRAFYITASPTFISLLAILVLLVTSDNELDLVVEFSAQWRQYTRMRQNETTR